MRRRPPEIDLLPEPAWREVLEPVVVCDGYVALHLKTPTAALKNRRNSEVGGDALNPSEASALSTATDSVISDYNPRSATREW
jgi:hypothetical protein